MRFRHPRQRRAQLGRLAGVDGDAGAAAAELERLHVKGLALAADHDRQPRGIGGVVVERPAQLAALVGLQQFEVAADRVGRALGLGRPGIGRVGVAQLAVGALGPDRPGRGGGEVAQQFGFFLQRLVAQVRFGEFAAHAAEFANPDNGLAADGAAHRLDGAAGRGGEVEQKSLAGFAQAHRPRDRSAAPVPAAARFRRRGCAAASRPSTSSEMSPLIRGRSSPAAQEISTCGSANSSARSRSAWACKRRDLDAQPQFVARGAQPGAHQKDRRHHGKAEQRQRGGQNREFLVIEVEPGRNRVRNGEIAGRWRFRTAAGVRRQVRSGRGAPVRCTTAGFDASPRLRPT